VSRVSETAYNDLHYSIPELPHPYGQNVHLLADVVLLSELAELSRPTTSVARCNRLVRDIYSGLIRYVVAAEFPREIASVPTRMNTKELHAVFTGQLVDPRIDTVVVDVARAGTLSAQVCFEFLGELLDPSKVRQDHVYLNRKTDDDGKVVGTHYSGSKIGGAVKDAMVLVPDPMGATGSSLAATIDIYKNDIAGPAKKYVAMNLIVTPEYIAYMTARHPDVIIYAVRIDRGMSSNEVLQLPLGTKGETGLNDKQYIVPGLGGLGELLNNSWV
jgi:uracil phosphoribosyltransferase